MNQREKLLAGAVGGLLALFAVWYVFDAVQSRLTARETELEGLQRKINERELIVRRGQIATKKLVQFEQQSLPGNIERAQSLYQKWLLDLLQKHKIAEGNVTAVGGGRISKGVYQQLTFAVKGRGDLAKVTRLLHDFYSVDRLHRLRRVGLKPLEDSTDIDIDLNVEVLAMLSAPNLKELKNSPSERLQYGDADAYAKAILERNFFGPPHLPPRVTSTARSTYPIGSSVSFSVRGEDPEKRAVTYSLEKASFDGGTLDEKTGAFTWKPETKGSYELTIRATDAGVPAKSTTHTVKFAIVDPPPPREPEKIVEKPKFDTAKFTYLTAVLDVGGQPEAWLLVRTTGQTLKLQVGEKFDVGTMQGVIRRIGEQDVEVETADGKRWLISIGENLREGFALPAGDI